MSREDPQKERVYKWEDSFRSFGERTLTRNGCRAVITRCCRLYGVPPPSIGFRSKAASKPLRLASDYDPSIHKIVLGYTDCNHAVCAHEAAHAILDYLEREVEDHGPEFFGIYLNLLEKEQVAPRAALEASARSAGIRWVRS